MPELPEVETMRRGLLPIVGCKIKEIYSPPCKCKPISILPSLAAIDKQLGRQLIQSISRVGKRVLIDTPAGSLVLQPKMTGLVTLSDVPDPDHVRLCVELRGSDRFKIQFWDRRGLGTVELIARDRIHAALIDGKLGPDALEIMPQEFHERLTKTTRAVKPALMDQQVLAGVGNLYASEILHACKLHPEIPANQLTSKQTARIHSAMIEILQTAIEYEGSTLSDGTYRNKVNDSGSYQNHHRVYDRANQTCMTCRRSQIVRIVQAQRSTFFCPRCQRAKQSV